MPSADEIQAYLNGVWRLMMGRQDGVRLLDVSADGFWNSFFSIVVALPAMVVGWVGAANGFGGEAAEFGGRLSIMMRMAVIEIASWVLPLVVLAAVARPLDIASRYAHFVVASNWTMCFLSWVMLPAALLGLIMPASDFTAFVALVTYLASMVLLWRMSNAVLAKGPAVASAVFAVMLFSSLIVFMLLWNLLGLSGQ